MKKNKKVKQEPKRFNLKILGKIAYWAVIAFLIIVALGVVFSAFNIPGGYKLFTVQSGSMEPAIKLGSVVVIQPKENYQEGDIITFKKESERNVLNPRTTTTHRIIEVKQENNKILYTTKGDANDSTDGTPVDKDLVLGKMLLAIPYLGYPVAFAKTQTGLILLVIIPAVIIIYGELLNVKKEVKNLLKAKAEKKDED